VTPHFIKQNYYFKEPKAGEIKNEKKWFHFKAIVCVRQRQGDSNTEKQLTG
jgi:hypothetical protein